MNQIHFMTKQILIVLLFVFSSCTKEAAEAETTTTLSGDTDDSAISLEGDLQISDFVWQGLNQFYYWQEEVNALADEQLNDEKAYAQ